MLAHRKSSFHGCFAVGSEPEWLGLGGGDGWSPEGTDGLLGKLVSSIGGYLGNFGIIGNGKAGLNLPKCKGKITGLKNVRKEGSCISIGIDLFPDNSAGESDCLSRFVEESGERWCSGWAFRSSIGLETVREKYIVERRKSTRIGNWVRTIVLEAMTKRLILRKGRLLHRVYIRNLMN